ncbi:hypothetical protein ACA910_008132 [Epithemia clementina (nom. ined.)]
MQRDRALLLVEKCLPQLLVRDGDNHASKVPPPTTGLESKDSVKLRKMCRLWQDGYIYQVDLWNGRYKFVIKHVAVPPSRNRQSFGDRRKAGSYLVEANFYGNLAAPLIQNHGIQLPLPYLVEHGPASGEITICMSLLEGTSIDMSKPDDVKSALFGLPSFIQFIGDKMEWMKLYNKWDYNNWGVIGIWIPAQRNTKTCRSKVGREVAQGSQGN